MVETNWLTHFIKAVKNDTAIISNGETSRHALETAMAAIESYQKGRAIGIK
jgi:hypothetical protein